MPYFIQNQLKLNLIYTPMFIDQWVSVNNHYLPVCIQVGLIGHLFGLSAPVYQHVEVKLIG